MKTMRIFASQTFSFSILFLLLFNSGQILSGQNMNEASEVDEIIRKTSGYLTAGKDRADEVLKELKFERPQFISQEDWRRTPSFTKIKMAYKAAENLEKGGGEKFLAMLSKSLAQEYESVRAEPALKRYFDASRFEFKGFSRSPDLGKVELPKDVDNTIAKLSKYTPGNRLGGLQGVLKVHFGLNNDQIIDVMNSSTSYEDALKKGYQKMLPPEARRTKLHSLVLEVQSSYSSAKRDPAFNKFVENNNRRLAGNADTPDRRVNGANNPNSNNRRAIPSESINRPNGTTSTPPARLPESSRVNSIRVFENANIPANGRGFDRIIRNARSFGGVIFGNTVEKDSNLDSINFIRWVPLESDEDNFEKGYLEFNFEGGDEKYYGPVFLEDFYAAYRIWFGSEAFPPLQNLGEGVGLVGIHEPNDFEWGRIWNVILNPYIADLELGWSALAVDALPICSTDIKRNVERYCSPEEIEKVNRWLEQSVPSTWKIIDIPTRIKAEGNDILVLPKNDSYRDGSFLSMQGFYGIFMDASEEVMSFHEITPFLNKSIYEYYRLNEFAKIFSIFQMLKAEDVLVESPISPTKVNIPTKLIIDYKNRKMVPLEKFKQIYVLPFDYNQSAVVENDEFFLLLRDAKNLIEFNPEFIIDIVGHTDIVGSDAFNYRLGLARANSVNNLLVENGIPSTGIRVMSMGKKQLKSTNDAENRRVEVVIRSDVD